MRRFSSAAVGSVLGAVACILVLAMCAACGGGGSKSTSKSLPSVGVVAGQTTTVSFPAP